MLYWFELYHIQFKIQFLQTFIGKLPINFVESYCNKISAKCVTMSKILENFYKNKHKIDW